MWVAAALSVVRGSDGWSPVARRRMFAAARVLPSLSALLFAALVVAPAYVLLEPRGGKETVGPLLLAIEIVALALVAGAPLRALRSWRETRRIESAWMRDAVGFPGPGGELPVWRLPAGADGVWTSVPGWETAQPVASPADGTAPTYTATFAPITATGLRVVMNAYANTHLIVSEVQLFDSTASPAAVSTLGALRVDDFSKHIHVVSVDEATLARLAPHVAAIAEAEGLAAHAESVRLRGPR